MDALGAFVDSIPAATARTVFAADVVEAYERIGEWVSRREPPGRTAVCHLTPPRPLRQLIDAALDELCEVAHAIWPHWYGRNLETLPGSLPTRSDDLESLFDGSPPVSLRGGIALSWLRQAVQRIAKGQPPRLRHMPRGRQVHQLALAITPTDLLFVPATDGPADARLLGFARLAEWLARQTQCPVCAVVPHELREATALHSIGYAAYCVPDAPRAPRTASEASEQKRRLWPLLGRPHPFSPGEQRLAERLADHPGLGSLFQFNTWVQSKWNNRYLVDLLWPTGKLVVEVDGYRTHSPRAVFAADRQRDYELLASGYRVLRITHDEIMQDVDTAVEKIHVLVRLRNDEFCRS